ncbi:MAG: diguanylate cyclase [Betaproteobacteria bacterium]
MSDNALNVAVAATPAATRARDLKFVGRVYRLRASGLALGTLCVAAVLRLHDAPLVWWLVLGVYGFFWPHFAMLLARRSADPRRAERRNLMVDSTVGGMWIAVMQFNLLPSVLLVTMLSIDKVSVGGAPLLFRTLAGLVVGCAVTSAALGFPVDIASPMSVVVASLPVLVVYPLAISAVTYGLARSVAHKTKRLEEMGRTDGLTGLGNRRHCFAIAEMELERHFRTGRPTALAILDIDRFKAINDRYGHPVGDDVLCRVAEVLRQCCRLTDTAARYGGDEFMLVLPETDLAGAEEVAQRIRTHMATMAIERAPNLRCTVSLGAAEADREIANVEVWIQQADAALYRAKAAGRNRFEAAPRIEPAAKPG